MRPATLILRVGGGCDVDPEHLLDVFVEQRRRFVRVLERFTPEDWTGPTRCADWSAHEVVRHLCDTTALMAGMADRALAAGFDPRSTPNDWLTASAGESPDATLARLAATTEELRSVARAQMIDGRNFDVALPYGPMDWTVLVLHGFWDSWIHERDILLARGAMHPTDGDATVYATAYGLFIAAVVSSMFGDQVQHEELNLGGYGGGVFDLDGRGAVTLTVNRTIATAGPSAAEVADALAGRSRLAAALGDRSINSLALSRLADFFNTPVQ